MKYRNIVIGTASACENPLTGSWLVFGQKDGGAYRTDTKSDAIKLAKTVDHYNKTGEKKAFTLKESKASIESDSIVES